MNYSNHESQQIAFIRNIIEQTLNLPISFLDLNPKPSSQIETEMMTFIDLTKTYQRPQIKLHSLDIAYLFTSYIKNDKSVGTFIIGPINYKQISLNQLNHYAILLHYLIYQEQLSVEDILTENFYDQQLIEQMDHKFQSEFTQLRMDEQIQEVFTPLHYEQELFLCVQHGDIDALMKVIDKFVPSQEVINQLNEDPLQIMKTMVFTLLILCSRAAMMARIPTALICKINTYYLDRICKATDFHQLNQLKITCLMDLTSRIQEINNSNISRLVSEAIFFIHKNLYQDISLNNICEALHVNPSYLSRLFKKEMKVTISEFIMKEKIEEVKRLLLLSNHTILEISILLHFSDQSYFTKSFKKVTGMTPKVYKNHYKLMV